MTVPRVICRYSCGAASAVATKMALAHYGYDRVEITYCDTGSEHPDNKRFLKDCERWFNKSVTVLRSTKFKDTWDVWETERFIMSRAGAPCTGALKREPWFAVERSDDILVMGYTAEEQKRADRLREQNFERTIVTPLIDAGLKKADCLAIIQRAGIELPAMYLLGFQNNNCIGCPKGGRGYWNMIRRHFPETFDRMARLQRKLDVAFWVESDGTKLYLDNLHPDRGVQHDEPDIECSVLCYAAEENLDSKPKRGYLMETPDSKIERWNAIKQHCETQSKLFSDYLKPFNEEKEAIEAWLLNFLNETKQNSAKTEHGTAYKSTVTKPKIVDRDAYLDWCLDSWDNGGNEMLQLGAPQIAAFETYIEEMKIAIDKGETPAITSVTPPGTEVSYFTRVNIRKS